MSPASDSAVRSIISGGRRSGRESN